MTSPTHRAHGQQGSPAVRLLRPPPAVPPELDAAQQRVVDHVGSPLLVLAGPGTGKTTTIVEAVAARLAPVGDAPATFAADEVLVLTFSRTAAAELRARIVARLGGAPPPLVATYHSFAWKLLREQAPTETVPERLLSGPDQDLAVRELLAEPSGQWAELWPPDRVDALRSPGMAGELLAVMSAARAHGWEPADLVAAAQQSGTGGRDRAGSRAEPGVEPAPPEWPAVAAFFEEYLQVLDWRGAVDYAEAVHRATRLVEDTPALVGRHRVIYLDEYQDTDPAQVALIRALAAPDTTVVAVGDPDQAVYRFRGADVRGILNFPDGFPARDGSPAPVAVLTRTRRFGPAIRVIADRWVEPVSLGGLPAEVQRTHRRAQCAEIPGDVELLRHRTAEQQAGDIADLLRRAHLEEGTPLRWSDMAVLVRSGTEDIPRLQRALLAAGVPVEVPASDRPLGHDPALGPLLTGLRLADEPEAVELEDLEAFLCSPLIGLSPLALRRMMRAMRVRERDDARRDERAPLASSELLRRCFLPTASAPTGLDPAAAEVFDRALRAIDRMRAPGLTLSERLWALWSHDAPRSAAADGGRWARSLRARALAGGQPGHEADCVLDSVVELFRLAERMPRGTGAGVFLDTLISQQIPGARPDEGGFQREAVRLLTVHRSKGAQWPLVVVVGLQQDRWPDVRGRASILAADRIGAAGLRPRLTQRELAEDERRLAFVAATRARRRLVISAVAAPELDMVPSALFAEAAEVLGEPVATEGVGAPAQRADPRSRLTPAALVASLRTALADEALEARERKGAARRLALLAGALGDPPLASSAAPARWWGLWEPTVAPTPLTPPDEPVLLSATAVQGILDCPLRWFLQRRAAADTSASVATGYGRVVHALVAAAAAGQLEPDVAAMVGAMDEVWGQLPFRAEWESQRQHQQAEEDLARFVAWLRASSRVTVGTEVSFDVVLPAAVAQPAVADVDGSWPAAEAGEPSAFGAQAGAVSGAGPSGVRLTGQMDLVDRGDDGRLRVVDFKTGNKPIPVKDTATNTQLGVYQMAVALGGAQLEGSPADGAQLESPGQAAAASPAHEPAGGALVYLGAGTGRPTERTQAALTEPAWLLEQLDEAARTVVEEAIVARECGSCRACAMRPVCPIQHTTDWLASP